MPKRTNEATPNLPPAVTPKNARVEEKLSSPTAKTNHVKIEIYSKNGGKLNEDLSTKTLIEIWKLLDTDAEIDGCSSHKKHGGVIKAYFFLKSQISLGELHPEPEFSYEMTTLLATDTFQCRIIGLNEVRNPKPGEIVMACITRTHFNATAEIIEQCISKFGEVVTKPRYCTKLYLNTKDRTGQI
jgi:hypothetical protein